MNERSGSVPFYEEVVRLVAVVQVSSAAVERVLSQLTFIWRAVGDHTLRYMVELMAYIRSNDEVGNDSKIVEVGITVVIMLFICSKCLDMIC